MPRPKLQLRHVQLCDFQPRSFHSLPLCNVRRWEPKYDKEYMSLCLTGWPSGRGKASTTGGTHLADSVLWQISLKMRVCLQYITMLDWSLVAQTDSSSCVHPPLPLSAWENDSLFWSEWVTQHEYDFQAIKGLEYINMQILFLIEGMICSMIRSVSALFSFSLVVNGMTLNYWCRPGCSGNQPCWTLSSGKHHNMLFLKEHQITLVKLCPASPNNGELYLLTKYHYRCLTNEGNILSPRVWKTNLADDCLNQHTSEIQI